MRRILAVCILILLGCLCVRTDSQAKIIVKNAKAGPHCTWSLDDKGTLTVKGKGKVKEVELTSQLYREYPNPVKKLVIAEGITAIGEGAIRDCRAATKIVLPKNLKKADLSFDRCFALRKIKNRSSLPIKLNTASGHRLWRVNGKKVTVLKPKKTAKTRGTKYRITYDLRGGVIKVQAAGDDIIWYDRWGADIYWYILRFRPVGGGQTWYSARLWGDRVDIMDRLEKGKEYICDISYGYGEAFEDVDEHEAWFLPRRIYVQP